MITKEHIENCIDRKTSALPDNILTIHGMTSLRIRHFLNNLLMSGDRYLEVGVFKGATFCAALYGNDLEYACAVDDWSSIPPGEFRENVATLKSPVDIFSGDCFSYDGEKMFNVYLFDGPKSTIYHALDHYYDFLDDEFIYMVDDYNLSSARKGTDLAISNLGLRVVYSRWMGQAVYNEKRTGEWWLGFYIAILKK